MPSTIAATAQQLQDLANASALAVKLEADALGVQVGLTESGLAFHHSFIAGPVSKRARQTDQLLLKACSNRQRSIHSVLDLTAGWGVDGFILARHGHVVTMLEQDKLIHGIVAWSLQQLANDAAQAPVAGRLNIDNTDALEYLQAMQGDQHFDCIYLDPMFPAHKSSAKPAKEMQILQALTGNSSIDTCFALALQRARRRVVVKRAAKAPPLTGQKPDLVHRAKSIRFDVYLIA
jgi:16S rRNA (guanine1516-N2)-methyltransferase